MPSVTPRHLACTLLLAIPAALSAQSGRAAPTPSAAVEEFMRALADSNLTRMAQLFGNAKGAAAKTGQPKDYEKRIIIMQAMLHGVQAQALGDVPGQKTGTRTVTTRLAHNGCTVTIPVNVAHAKEGWLVEEFNLTNAAVVNKPCETSRRPGTR